MALLSDEEISERLGGLEGWRLEDTSIVKDFKRDDFKGSVAFVDALLPEAEDMGHHPDLQISWDTVTVSLSTHSQGGLTEADFELAGRIDALA
jgi:4a-hydroxytetrahydrobiopterin dehydratase